MPNIWPKIDDLPAEEQADFIAWLRGQTVPVRSDGEDAYYTHDYVRFKAGLPVID